MNPSQFGGEPLWKRPERELPAHMQTGLGGSTEPRQLKMFMTPNEIMDEYQPLDGDRAPIDDEVPLSNQARRPHPGPTADGPQYPVERDVPIANGVRAWGNTTGGDAYYRSEGGTAKKIVDTREENDDEVWDRKLAESKMPPNEYDIAHNAYAKNMPEMSDVQFGNSMPVQAKHEGTWSFEEREHEYYMDKEMQQDARYEEKLEAYESPDNSLYNQIAREGVKSPVSLNDPGNYSRFGESGKPQVAGGHHRLAAQFDQDPEKLMPVLHFAGGTNEAKENEYYKYS